MPILKIEEAEGERDIELRDKSLTIGRLPENEVVIKDETVSRQHAEIVLKPDGYTVKDLGTRNGTWVNGRMIKEILLKDQDVIRIGTTILRFISKSPSIRYEQKEEWLNNPSTMIRPLKGPSIDVSEKKLKILYNISQAISSIFAVRELAEKIAEEVFGIINADRFLLMLKDEKTSALVPEIAIGKDKKEVELNISRTMVNRVTTEGVSILVQDTLEDSRFRQAQSLISTQIRSILCAPLWSKEGIIGLLYVDSKKSGRSFSEDELGLLTVIGNQAAVAFQNIRAQQKLWQKKKMERELEIAAKIQQSFLPSSFPSCSGYTFGVKTIAAHNIGGDFYDCFNISPTKIGVVIGDVSGKGIPAALYMARFLSEFKLASLNFQSPGLLMNEMNKRLKEIVMGGNFVSAIYLILEMDTGKLTYAMGGCHPILLYRDEEKTVKELCASSGQILGVGKGTFSDEGITMRCGDMVIIYTDGVIEARGRKEEEYGLERLKELVIRFKDLSVNDITEKAVEDIFKFSHLQEPSDDLTLLILKRASG